MRPIQVNPNNAIYYSEDFIKGFECGAKRQLEADERSIPRGHWMSMADFEQCSVCHGTHLKEVDTYYGKAVWVKTDYCPNCGAKMVEERSEENEPY